MTTIRLRPTHRHVKSGKLIAMVARGRHEADLEPVVGYIEIDTGDFWTRRASVFDDGRFERLPPMDYAWLIEMGASKVSDPLYFSGMDSLGRFNWTRDNMLAVRFVREQDAVKVAGGDTFGTKHRICEHGWEAVAEHGFNGTRHEIAPTSPPPASAE